MSPVDDHLPPARRHGQIISHKLGILPLVDTLLMLGDGQTELFGSCDKVLSRIVPACLRPVGPVVQAAHA